MPFIRLPLIKFVIFSHSFLLFYLYHFISLLLWVNWLVDWVLCFDISLGLESSVVFYQLGTCMIGPITLNAVKIPPVLFLFLWFLVSQSFGWCRTGCREEINRVRQNSFLCNISICGRILFILSKIGYQCLLSKKISFISICQLFLLLFILQQ